MKTRTFVATVVAVAALGLFGCGKTQTQGGPAPKPTGRSQLILFGAGYCTTCKVRFPELATELAALPAAEREAIDVKLFVTSGDPASVRPTDELAKAYQQRVHLPGTAQADPWRWKNFRKLVGSNLEVPAAVVVDGSGKVARVFTAGDTTFVPQEIVAVAASVASAGAVK